MVDLQRAEGWHEWPKFCRLHSNSQVVKHSSFAGVELANCMSHCDRLPTSRQRRHSPAAFLRWHDSYDSVVILEPFLIPCEDPKSVALQEERFQVVTEHVTHLVRGAVSELEPLVEGLQVVEPHIFQSTEKDDEGTEVNEHVELDHLHGLRRARDVNTGPLVGAAVWARRNARNIHTIAFTTEPWPAGHSSQLGRVTPKMATVAAFWSIAQQHGALALGIMIRVVANEACGLGPGGCRGIIQAAAVWRSYIRRNCRYFSFRPSVSALGFGPRVSRPLHLSGIHLKYPSVRTELHNCTQLHNIRITQASCLNCYLLRMQHEARGTFGRNMVEYHMVRGPKPRAEMIE